MRPLVRVLLVTDDQSSIAHGGFLRWSELRTVRYGATMKWFRLETQGGVVVRISGMLMGLPEFARALLRGAPTASIDPAALPVLEATADGDPPSLWG